MDWLGRTFGEVEEKAEAGENKCWMREQMKEAFETKSCPLVAHLVAKETVSGAADKAEEEIECQFASKK